MGWRTTLIFVAAAMALWACTTSSGIVVNVNFERLSGLEKDDRVLFENNTAGRIKSVSYNADGTYTVQVAIDEGFVSAATEYAQFQVVEDPERQGRKGIRIQISQPGGVPLADGATVVGVPQDEDLAAMIRRELDAGIDFLKKKMEEIGRDVQNFPESREFQELKESLEELADELQQKEKATRERLKKEWLPKLQRELDALRERLREKGSEDQMAPLDQEMERIRRI